MPKDELAGMKSNLVEQTSMAGNQGKKRGFMTFGRRGRHFRRTTWIT